jgi:rhodanese-related sulfurtransferase
MNRTSPLEIDCQQAAAKLREQSDDFVLIDCREEEEHAIAHIAAARLMPMSQIMARAAELDPLREKHVVVHCHHGGRSLKVTQWLRSQGFDLAQSMAGGIDAWSQQVDPSVPRY